MKTLCKHCKICAEYTYKRTMRTEDMVSFKYCEGNKYFIEQFEYAISHPNSKGRRLKVLKSHKKGYDADEVNATPTTYMLKDPNNVTEYLNNNVFDLRLKNLREITWRCLVQKRPMEEKSSIFPGVRLQKNKYCSRIHDGDKIFNCGCYDDEMDAYHAYVLRCEKLGFKVNQETKGHKKYLKEYNSSNFVFRIRKRASEFEGVTTDRGKFVALGTKEGGKRKRIAQFDKELDAFHAHVLWCKLNDKEVDTENYHYREFLKDEKPAMILEEFIKSRRKQPTSKYRNVSFFKQTNRWVASFHKNNKCVYKKYFDNEYEAHLAVENERKKFGLD